MSVVVRTGRRSARRFVATLAALVCAAALLVALPTAPAQAADASQWDAGYIIDDAVFYDAAGMSAADVQTFLNGRVRSCAGGYTCLKDYAQSTSSISGDAYCGGYQGSSRETAAQIIDKVARSCGINQRALIVLLEKEQGLVSSSAPGSWAYQAATGQGCPDTAPCDPNTAGFFYQVYYAARQFKVYQAHPTSFGYIAQRWNNILYNPNTGCGTQRVFIQNQATAALYIYTPYTPNQSALANLYGTGDACASYGNRNFWRLYTDWFGDPRRFTVLDGFVSYWNANGGAGGKMGNPVSYAVFVDANGQGWYQRFQGGTVYGSFYGGTVFIPNGSTLTEFTRQGGPAGSMSWPNGEQVCSSGSRCMQSFVGATMSSTPTYGAHAIWGGILDHWRNTGQTDGSLGPALNDMVYLQTASGVAWVQNFERGVLAQSANGFRLVPYSPLQDAWARAGGAAGRLGWPVSDYACAGTACAQTFAAGVVTSDRTWGGHVVGDSFLAEWNARGGLAGLGAALNDSRQRSESGGGTVQNFSAGVMTSTSSGTILVPYGPIQASWSASGGETGQDGWPVTAQSCTPAGDCAQSFQRGSITRSPTWGTHRTFGAIDGAWRAGGGLGGYGPALTDLRYGQANGGGWAQHFGSGIVTQRAGGQPVYSAYGPILSMWYNYGAENTWLGWPSAPASCAAGSCTQQFQNGVARSTPDGQVSFATR